MLRKLYTVILACILVLPEAVLAQQTTTRPAAQNYPAASPAASSPQSSAQSQPAQSVRPQSTAQRQSYEREVRPRRRRSTKISKGEIAFMAGIAGTSMGIGAIAAGGEGLAIGAIVGGWGAYVGHRIWNRVK